MQSRIPCSPGFCDYTEATDDRCGTPGVTKGSWRVGRAASCVSRCEACEACQFVSFDPAERDCSWFTSRSCDPARLKILKATWHHTLVVRSGVTASAVVTPRPLPEFPPIPPTMTEDGSQGHTPYFYKMDEPVRVRRTTSYGRGWQLLRSRGAGNEELGPCDPPQTAGSCGCSDVTTASSTDDDMPSCVRSAACGGGGGGGGATAPAAGVAIVLVLDMTRDDLRFPFGGNVRKAYEFQLRYVVRLLLSLRRVGNSLPVRLLASGERNLGAERQLAASFGATALPAGGRVPQHRAPAWASKWALSSFAKLRVLALTQFSAVVLLDNDTLVLRNIDSWPALALPPAGTPGAPDVAAVFGTKCWPRRELRAAAMVVRPNQQAMARAQALMADPATPVYDDNGEGSVWRRLHGRVSELPAGFCALRTSNFTAEEWAKVSVLHDPHLMHGFHRSGYEAATAAIVQGLEEQTSTLMVETFAPLLKQRRELKQFSSARGQRRGRGRGTR